MSAFYDVINDPLVELDAQRNTRRSTLMDSFNSLDFSFAYGIYSDLQAGLSTSFSLAHRPDGSSSASTTDSRLFVKYRLNDPNALVVVALLPELYLPTGSADLFLSDSSVGAGARLVAERDFRYFQVAANAGYRYSPNAHFRDLDLRQVIPLSLGVLVPLSDRWAINGDATGKLSLPLNSYQNPTFFYAGGRYRISRELLAAAGASIGSFNGRSSADYQIIAGITLMPNEIQTAVADVSRAPAPQKISGVSKQPKVSFNGSQLVIADEIKFEHNRATLMPEGKKVLDEVASVLKAHRGEYKSVAIEGHANELGTYPYNQKLSERRASTVRTYLARQGVDDQTLTSIGYGKTHPKAPKSAPIEQRLPIDRRVEFKLKK